MSAATSTSTMANSYYQMFNLHHHNRQLPVGHHRASSRVSATIFNQHSVTSASSTYKHVNTNFLGNIQGLSINFDQRARIIKRNNIIRKKMNVTVYAGIIPGVPLPSSDNWKGWVIGLILSIALPLLKYKSPLLALKHEVVKVVVSIDSVAEIIEKVAVGVEKVADEVADHLPEGKLKEAALCLENIAHETAKDAHIADEFLDKVVEVGDEMEKEMVKCGQEVVTTTVATDVAQMKEEVVVTTMATDVIEVKEEAPKEDQSNKSIE